MVPDGPDADELKIAGNLLDILGYLSFFDISVPVQDSTMPKLYYFFSI